MKTIRFSLFIGLQLSLAVAVAQGQSNNSKTDWFSQAQYGVFMHFLPSGAKALEQVSQFDVQNVAEQLEETGARYLILTLGQNSGYFNSPNRAYDKRTGYAPGERCATRDLPLELYQALHLKGIRLMLYLPCQVPNQDVRAQKAFGLPEGAKDQPIDLAFAEKWSEVIQEWADRYGDKVAGWWFDGGYEHVGFNDGVAQRYAAAVKHGNPNAIVTFNPGVKLTRWTKAEDYTAGELNEPLSVVPASRWVDGSQWHALTYLGDTWGKRNTRYPDAQWIDWARKVAAAQGVFTLDVGPNYDAALAPVGALADAQVKQVKAIGAALSQAAPAGTNLILEYHNPVWDGYLADPQVLETGGEYYAYGTGDEHNGRQFPVLHSKNFLVWEFVGNALVTVTEPKMEAYWAPEVAEKDGRFFLYYAGHYKMRVAVADHPAGPFNDAGKLLFPDEPFSIDGHPYRDPESGKWYLFFAKDFLDKRVGTALAVAELAPDMTSVRGPVQTVLRAVGDWQIYERNRTMYGQRFDAWHTVEAPFIVLRNNQYYCFYSGGNWQTPGYGVGFAVSDRVTGPYRDEANLEGATVLKSIPDKVIGPGHNSIILGPDRKTHFIVYHSWNPERTKRQMCLDPVEWTESGPRALNPSRGKKRVTLPLDPGGGD